LSRIAAAFQRQSWVVALVALFAAISTAGYAANAVKKNSVTSKSIKDGAVTGKDVKDGSLTAVDFSGSVEGERGPQGPQGEQGIPGSPGTSVFDSSIPSGETVTGGIAVEATSAAPSGTASAMGSLPIPTATLLTSETVDVDGSDEVDGRCTGTGDIPTAPPGVLCVYTLALMNVADAEGVVLPTGRQQVFFVNVESNLAGSYAFQGIWAYTAP
jgi:hypothetical protein